jgi:hypothetical protein
MVTANVSREAHLANCTVISFLLAGALACAASTGCNAQSSAPREVGLGVVLTSKDGQIYGFDIDRNGNGAVLGTAGTVETFDQDTGKIRRSFGAFKTGHGDYVVPGIAAGGVALIESEHVPAGQLYPHRRYRVMNPVTANKFTGDWTPPLKGIIMEAMSDDQASQTSSMFALKSRKDGEAPIIVVSDVASNTFTNVIPLSSLFGVGSDPQFAQYSAANQAVIALSPDGGAVGGRPPMNYLIDLTTGTLTSFQGYNNGFFHAGSVDGLAVDPNTGVAATTTGLNSQVEFYDLKTQRGITFTQLPCSTNTDETHGGTSITNDPVNKLFLVTEPNYCDEGSAVLVYDETGVLVETITGFNVPGNVALGAPPRINPGKRLGWLFGGPDGPSQLQQFFY